MTLERADLEEVDKVVLPCRPAVTRVERQADRDAHGVVGEGLDTAARDVAAVADEDEAEADDDRGEVDCCGRPDVVPAIVEA